MHPPPIILLQSLNAALGMATYLVMALGQDRWTAHGWTSTAIAAAVSGGMVSYAMAVGWGGRCAERFGRARTALVGISLVLVGALLPVVDGGPWSPVVAWVVMNLGCAFFFPSNAGLFSDAEGASGGPVPALHRKVSNYNIGWSGGNLLGFAVALSLVGTVDDRLGFAVSLVLAGAMGAVLWRWRSLRPSPPPPVGDRAPHPHLAALTVMGRMGLLLACLFGMAVLGLAQQALTPAGADGAAQAQVLARSLWLGYAAGYVAMFIVLGRWSGWVLRPWRLLLIQSGMALAAAGYVLVGTGHLPAVAWCLALLGVVQGLGYGAAYTGSLYYSMRLPEGASRAAGLHETFLGIGSIIGLLAAGAFLDHLVGGVTGLGWWGLIVCLITATMQVAVITRLPHLERSPSSG